MADHVIVPVYTYVTKRLVSRQLRGWQNNVMDHHPTRHMYKLKLRSAAPPPAVDATTAAAPPPGSPAAAAADAAAPRGDGTWSAGDGEAAAEVPEAADAEPPADAEEREE
jgi:hypothetical protein